MDSFEQLTQAIRLCTPEQKQKIFAEIRDSILIHNLERAFNIRAEVILEAISRSNDLTQRGVRGVIAETVFVLDVMPTATGWQSDPPVGDGAFDACLRKDERRVRIQVKMQRKKAGAPWLRFGSHVVEVQRTRGGQRDGISTRPYRFGEFDLLAVCMEPAVGRWNAFMYAPARSLTADTQTDGIIAKYQAIPDYETGEHGIWSKDLATALERVF